MTILELMYLSLCIFHFDKENHQGEERRHKPVKLMALEKFKERRHKQSKSSHCPAVLTTIEMEGNVSKRRKIVKTSMCGDKFKHSAQYHPVTKPPYAFMKTYRKPATNASATVRPLPNMSTTVKPYA
jgi:hypothetical protein